MKNYIIAFVLIILTVWLINAEATSLQSASLKHRCEGNHTDQSLCLAYINGYVSAYETWAQCDMNTSIVEVSVLYLKEFDRMSETADMRRIKADAVMLNIIKHGCK